MAERGWWVRGRTACLTLRARTACRRRSGGFRWACGGCWLQGLDLWAAVGAAGAATGAGRGPGQPSGSRCTGSSEAWAMWGWKWLQSRKLVRKALLQTWQVKGFTEHSSSWCRSSCLGAGRSLPHSLPRLLRWLLFDLDLQRLGEAEVLGEAGGVFGVKVHRLRAAAARGAVSGQARAGQGPGQGRWPRR